MGTPSDSDEIVVKVTTFCTSQQEYCARQEENYVAYQRDGCKAGKVPREK